MPSPGKPFEKITVDERWEATITIKGAKQIRIANGSGYFDDPAIFSNPNLADISLSADTLEKLVLRIKQHMDLLEE